MSKILDLIGLTAVVAAAALVALPLGLLALGASCLLVSWRTNA